MNKYDEEILSYMQSNPAATAGAVAEAVGRGRATTAKRITRLRAAGKIPPFQSGQAGEKVATTSRLPAAPRHPDSRVAPLVLSDIVRALCAAYEDLVRLELEIKEARAAIQRFRAELGAEDGVSG